MDPGSFLYHLPGEVKNYSNVVMDCLDAKFTGREVPEMLCRRSTSIMYQLHKIRVESLKYLQVRLRMLHELIDDVTP